MRKSKLNKIEKEIRNLLEKEELLTLEEMELEVNKIMEKYDTFIGMVATENNQLRGMAVFNKKGDVILGCMAKAGREEMKVLFKEEIENMIIDFNKQHNNISEVVNLIDKIYVEYPISELGIEVINNELVLEKLEFDY